MSKPKRNKPTRKVIEAWAVMSKANKIVRTHDDEHEANLHCIRKWGEYVVKLTGRVPVTKKETKP